MSNKYLNNPDFDIKYPEANEYAVHWEQWVDPFRAATQAQTLPEEPDETEFDDFEEVDDELLMDEMGMQMSNQFSLKAILTPHGIIPATEQTMASQNFKFWMGHTNFRITPDILEIISNTDGVEAIDVYTSYRFRIAVGVLFKDGHVFDEVKKNCAKYMKELKSKE